MLRLQTNSSGFAAAWKTQCQRNSIDRSLDATVTQILDDVALRGEEAVLHWSAKFDETQFASLSDARLIPQKSWLDDLDENMQQALNLAADRIRHFHQEQKPKDFELADEQGNRMGSRWTAVQRAGLYVPGGKAAYPSSVLMNAIPARVAGVQKLIMVTPPGYLKAEVRAAAFLAGVDEVYTLGGIQAIGALAYGAGALQPVDVIVGPGNRYVAAAKRLVYGTVQIDMIAGPSEILVLADGTIPAAWVAADLVSQAEHDEAAVCGLVCTDEAYMDEVVDELHKRAQTTPRSNIALASIRDNAFTVLAADKNEMVTLSNQFAPEHLELAVSDPENWRDLCTEAGSIFMGRWTPEAVGDYLAGPNHVLPTSGTARFCSPLGVDTFMKRSGWMQWTRQGLEQLGNTITALAEAEELSAHAESIRVRKS